MQTKKPQWAKRLLIITVLGILCVVLILFYVFYVTFDYREIETQLPRDLVYAKARWTTNPVSHYRLKMIRYLSENATDNCEWVAEVKQEQIITTLVDTCPTHTWFGTSPTNAAFLGGSAIRLQPEIPTTISALFTRLERETTMVTFGQDARCGDLDVMKITYDWQYGYPKQIVYTRKQATIFNMGIQTFNRYMPTPKSFRESPQAIISGSSCLTRNVPTLGSAEITLTPLS